MSSVAAIVKLAFKEIVRKKDFYVALALMAAILLFASRMDFYNAGGVSRYLRELGLSLIFLFSALITVPLAARQYPAEVRDRTLAVLMAKPVSRHAFILGKYLGAALAGIAAFAAFYGVFLLFTLQAPPEPVTALQTGLLFAMGLAVLAAMATGLSFYVTFSANVTLCLGVYVLMLAYGENLRDIFGSASAPARIAGEICYRVLPHFEFFDLRQRFIHEWGPVPAALVGAVAVYAALTAGFFLLAAWLKFRRSAA